MKFNVALSMLCLCVFASSAVAVENPLDGEWTITSMKIKGKERKGRSESVFKVTGDTYTVTVGSAVIRGVCKTDDSKSPKHVDLITKDSQGRDAPALGIYKIDGDVLQICMKPSRGGKVGPRPTAFDSNQGTLMTYKRKT
ncbi:MAG: TIGR03067 domain-containing protein [Pirellulales bacterium]|nr:TIGR03067 domain-containing protein [Pirellulales bacterium]